MIYVMICMMVYNPKYNQEATKNIEKNLGNLEKQKENQIKEKKHIEKQIKNP
jgi:hypothetical protein